MPGMIQPANTWLNGWMDGWAGSLTVGQVTDIPPNSQVSYAMRI